MEKRIISASAIKSVIDKIGNKEFYDAAQMGHSLINRCVSKGRDVEAVNLCHHFAKEFLKVEQYALAANLGIAMITVFKEFELPPTADREDLILDIFQPSSSVCPERFMFIEKAISWSSHIDSSSADTITRDLHVAAGKAYQKKKDFGKAQGHLLLSNDSQLISLLLKEWKENVYPSEKELLILRAILMLISKNDIICAKEVLNSQILGINWDSDTAVVLPPLQLAYLMVETCQCKNRDFFDTLQTKYSLVIRRDSVLSKLIEIIDQSVFNRQCRGSTGILSMLSSLMGTMATPALC